MLYVDPAAKPQRHSEAIPTWSKHALAGCGPWGHSGMGDPFFGDLAVLGWSLWCETCHVLQLALLPRPEPESALPIVQGEVL